MKFSKYYFENFPINTPYNFSNPRHVLSQEGADEILEKIILHGPFSLKPSDFDNTELVDALLHIEVLQQKNKKLAIAVPFFVASDADVLKKLSKKAAHGIACELIKQKQQIRRIVKQIHNRFSPERNLYHLLGGSVFDGLMFDHLEEKGLVTTSRVHPSGLDYLVILYEEADCLNEYSNLLLCSFNRLTSDGKGFVSFGDSNGIRKDFYRYMRLKEAGRLPERELKYVRFPTEGLIDNFCKAIDGVPVPPGYIEIFEFFGYCRGGVISVPVYDARAYDVADHLYRHVLDTTGEKIADALNLIQDERRLSAVAHEVPVKDIANEIYHLIFGEVNEILIQEGLIAAPPFSPGEGRYFSAFER